MPKYCSRSLLVMWLVDLLCLNCFNFIFDTFISWCFYLIFFTFYLFIQRLSVCHLLSYYSMWYCWFYRFQTGSYFQPPLSYSNIKLCDQFFTRMPNYPHPDLINLWKSCEEASPPHWIYSSKYYQSLSWPNLLYDRRHYLTQIPICLISSKFHLQGISKEIDDQVRRVIVVQMNFHYYLGSKLFIAN